MLIDRARFWQQYRIEFGRVHSSQLVASVEALLGFIEDEPGLFDVRHAGYVLATIRHESGGTYRPIREWGRGSGKVYARACPLYRNRIRRFYGRGFVQLTWLGNYADWSVRLGVNLIADPDLAMQPDIAWRICYQGMRDGTFNAKGHGLEYYIDDTRCDYVEARRTVNVLDRAEEIATIARQFESVLVSAL